MDKGTDKGPDKGPGKDPGKGPTVKDPVTGVAEGVPRYNRSVNLRRVKPAIGFDSFRP